MSASKCGIPGSGLHQSSMRRIFEEFYQVGHAPDNGSRGLGLGLAIVDRLARLLGLQVKVRSVQGHGSVFAIDVQRADYVERAHIDPAGPVMALRFDAMPVLLIDDDPIARDATEGLLCTQWGCQVFSAARGEDAMQPPARGHAGCRGSSSVITGWVQRNWVRHVVQENTCSTSASDIPAVIISADAGDHFAGRRGSDRCIPDAQTPESRATACVPAPRRQRPRSATN